MRVKPVSIIEPDRQFDIAEFERRLAYVQHQMDAQDLDVLLLSTEADVRYYSGFLTQFWQSPTRPWFLLVPISGMPVAVIPSIGATAMARSWITDIRTWSSPHPTDDGVTLLQDTLVELCRVAPRIGVPMGRETHVRMPLTDLKRLQSKLASAEWMDATEIVQQQRQVKSEAEIGKIRHTCTLVSAAFEKLPDQLFHGMTEIETFRLFKLICLQEGIDDTAYLVGGAGPGGYDDIISPPSQHKLSTGDVLILDTGCTWDGYFCDFDRNFGIGNISQEASDAYAITWEATEAGLEAAKPGATCSDLFHAMNNILSDHAVTSNNDVGRLGHGLGMQLTESPSITPFDHTPLQPGMVMTLEPGLTFANGKMMVHEEDIAITNDGAELLTKRAAQQIPIIA